MTNSQNVELEAAKFLHKLIQESKDEPTKLATKLYVILQHMRSSGKENSMPYQVISRAMETVIKQHNLDIEALMSSRLPLAGGTQVGDSTSLQLAGAAPCSYPPSESSGPMNFGSSSYDNPGFAAKISKDRSMEVFPTTPSSDLAAGKSAAGKPSDHGAASTVVNANKIIQSGAPSSIPDTNMLRSLGLRETGKSPAAQAPSTGMPFKEQQLKQLRAQCLVFLAFRNGLSPKKLHLEIALGNFYSKEDGAPRDLIDQKEEQGNDPSNIPEASRQSERLVNTKGHSSFVDSRSSKGAEVAKMMEDKRGKPSILSENAQDRRNQLVTRRELDAEMPTLETVAQTPALGEQYESNTRNVSISNHGYDLKNTYRQIGSSIGASVVIPPAEQLKHEESSGTGIGFETDASKASFPAIVATHDSVPQRKDDALSLAQSPTDCSVLGNRRPDGKLPSYSSKDQWKPILGMSGQSYPEYHLSALQTDREEDDISISTGRPHSPKHTTLEKWILDFQKRKVIFDQSRALKQQKTEQRIAARSDKLKENVSCSEDISAKTKSVIELKKLQLLELQRSLRSDILNDFFKPIACEMERLKAIKKNRIGRRSKQLERYEQKMKEERQKRTRERQKDFFSEIEVHREKLEDVFKVRRERWKGFNKYAREFHKRKERFHREKIDRIQREKINLLKINDVEGYLRMVKDAKSDRVKQLLKETEKYLQKLGSKLKEAKTLERQFETDMDGSNSGVEENEIIFENEDEKDQAKHYMESNEKYYLMAHSIKENIGEQPTCLERGKLREYQMNGLRWLVSLYNNHLNGILADEMGLGKTVQVISLICYLMETKNDRGPFLVVVPSSVLPGWESEINFWAPSIHKIVYSGPPEERRRLFKEQIAPQKFNVLLTTYEYLMNKHDRPKLSKVHWHYLIIDEGHRIKNASCKLNAELKHYRSNHRLLLTGTPLQNNLEELWALLNFLLPNIFNSSEDFSQWFNKPFESNGDNSPDEALLSEEENLLIINRLHQVLRPFVLRRLKHKVEHQLPEKIERLIRCEASGYQKLLMKRVEENLGVIGTSKARSVHNSVMELRNICNHPYLSQLHVEEVHDYIPKHYLPNIVRLCGKLEMLDRLLPKLKATDHRVLLFSTMTRLLDVMEDYLCWKQYKYLRLDGHTSGGDRGALIEKFNQPGSPYFIFLLSIRAGGVGVNLQAADTVIIFDTDWNPQVDLQAQARAHRIGQKKDVLVLRLETVQTVEEQVRAAAEHKLGVANQSITAGFFDNNTSAEDRREYLEALLRECKKEEATPVLDDDALNDLIARSGSEIDIFDLVDKQRQHEEMVAWQNLFSEKVVENSSLPPLPSRLLVDDDLKLFYKAMKISEVPNSGVGSNVAIKRKSGSIGGLDTQHYGRGKRAREVRSYEEQWTEEEFERMCQAESPESPIMKEEMGGKILPMGTSDSVVNMGETQVPVVPQLPQYPTSEPLGQQSRNTTLISKRGRGRPKRMTVETSTPIPRPAPLGARACEEQWKRNEPERICKVESLESPMVKEEMTGKMLPMTTSGSNVVKGETQMPGVVVKGEIQMPAVSHLSQHQTADSLTQQSKEATPSSRRGRGRPKRMTLEITTPIPLPAPLGAGKMNESSKGESDPMVPAPDFTPVRSITGAMQQFGFVPNSEPTASPLIPASQPAASPSPSGRGRGRGRKPQTGEPSRRRGKRQSTALQDVSLAASPSGIGKPDMEIQGSTVSSSTVPPGTDPVSLGPITKEVRNEPSSVPSIIALPSPSKLGVGSQVPISIPLKVPEQNSAPGTSVVASISQQETGVVSALTSQVTPTQASANPGAPSITPSLSVAKQGRGRARKVQSEETSQRRRRRQEPLVPVVQDGLTCQDSNSTTPPEKKTRRKSNTSKQGNESQELANASQSVPPGFDDLSARQIPKGSTTDADVSLDKSKDPCPKQTADEVVVSKPQVCENLPSTSSTLELPVQALSLPLSESSNQSLEECVAQDNKYPLLDSSFASNPEVPEDCNNPGMSEGASLPILSGASVELTKDRTLNIKTPMDASTFGSTVQASDCEKSESQCRKESDEIIVSAKNPEMDKSIASDNVSIRAEVSSIPVEMTKDQSLNTGTIEAAQTSGSMTLAGDSVECEPPFGKERDKIVEHATNLNMDESVASDDMPKGKSSLVSEMLKDRTNNESGEVVAEREKDDILAKDRVSTQSSIEVEVPSLNPEQNKSKHSCEKGDAEKQESKETAKVFDSKPESIVSQSLPEESFPVLSTLEKVDLSSDSTMSENLFVRDLKQLESGSHHMDASVVSHSEFEIGSNSVKEDAEEKRRDLAQGEALLSLSEIGNSQCMESSTMNSEVPVDDDLLKESLDQCGEKIEAREGKVSEVHMQETEACENEMKSAAISPESMEVLGSKSEEKSPSCIKGSSKMEASNVEPQTVKSQSLLSSTDDVDGKILDMDEALVSNPEPEKMKFESRFELDSSVDVKSRKNSCLDVTFVSHPEPQSESQFLLDSAVDVQGSKTSGLNEAVVSDPEPQSENQFVLDPVVDAQRSKDSGLDEAVVSNPESHSKSQFALDSAVDAQGTKTSGLDEAVVSDPEPQSESQFVLDSAVDAQRSKDSGLDEAVVSDPEPSEGQFVLDSAVDAQRSKDSGLDEAVVSNPESQSKSQFVLDSADDAQGSKTCNLDEAVDLDPESQSKGQFVLDSAVDARGSKNTDLDEAVVSDPESQSKNQFVLDSVVDARGSENLSLNEGVISDHELQSQTQVVLDSAVDAGGSKNSGLDEGVIPNPEPQSQPQVVLDPAVDAGGSKNYGLDEGVIPNPEPQSQPQVVLDSAVDGGSKNSGLYEAVVSKSESRTAKSGNQVGLDHAVDVRVSENFKKDDTVVMNPEPQNVTSESKLGLDSAVDLQRSKSPDMDEAILPSPEPQTMKSKSQDEVPVRKNSNGDEAVFSKSEEPEPSQTTRDEVDIEKLGEGNTIRESNIEVVSAVSLADNLKDDIPCDTSSGICSSSSTDDSALVPVTDKCSSATENIDKNDPQQ
ncbi:chromatin structure-remodeling complex SYD [Olea europaea subsp. europaea]|uniref:Chromatin structure-remodeling complex SYD n=1 Tax=Olea europaea subsp. europaea TaxID=158383 RepID=A0A8S0PK00_OLEEU|nr:chromatin structure-remodeling complex SYD [Olea europaea subsp. europaea]